MSPSSATSTSSRASNFTEHRAWHRPREQQRTVVRMRWPSRCSLWAIPWKTVALFISPGPPLGFAELTESRKNELPAICRSLSHVVFFNWQQHWKHTKSTEIRKQKSFELLSRRKRKFHKWRKTRNVFPGSVSRVCVAYCPTSLFWQETNRLADVKKKTTNGK